LFLNGTTDGTQKRHWNLNNLSPLKLKKNTDNWTQ